METLLFLLVFANTIFGVLIGVFLIAFGCIAGVKSEQGTYGRRMGFRLLIRGAIFVIGGALGIILNVFLDNYWSENSVDGNLL